MPGWPEGMLAPLVEQNQKYIYLHLHSRNVMQLVLPSLYYRDPVILSVLLSSYERINLGKKVYPISSSKVYFIIPSFVLYLAMNVLN